MYNVNDKLNTSNFIQNKNKKYGADQDSSSEEDNEPFQGFLLSIDEDDLQQSSYSQNDPNAFNNEFEEHENKGTLNIGEILTIEGYRIQIEQFLAEGGKAHVYTGLISERPKTKLSSLESNQALSAKKCVIKRVASADKDDLALIEKEVSFMKKLQGKPNIVEYYASKTQSLSHGQGFETLIIMEYCAEGTLVEFMQQREHTMLKEPEILYFFHEICLGVTSMHQSEPPIIHRDLKVENVLISSAQGLKLCDFGSSTTDVLLPGTNINVARAQEIEDELGSCTTLQYRSPEMIDLFQRRGLTEKMDIWALGVLLYKLSYFTTPFEDTGSLAILNCKFDFPSYPDISHAIKTIIGWMLQENPADRPDIEQVVQEICRLRNVPCTITQRKPITRIQPEAPTQGHKKTNSILDEPLLAPISQSQNPLLDIDPKSITPMPRGRPTKQKAPAPLQALVFPNDTASKSVAEGNADPFEMLAKGFELPNVSQKAVGSSPRPPSGGEESPWAVFESTTSTPSQPKSANNMNQKSGTFFSSAFQEKIVNSSKPESESLSTMPGNSFKPNQPMNLRSQSNSEDTVVSPPSTHRISEQAPMQTLTSKSEDVLKKRPPLPPPKPLWLTSKASPQAPPRTSPQAPPRIPPRSRPTPSTKPSPALSPPKPAPKPRSSILNIDYNP